MYENWEFKGKLGAATHGYNAAYQEAMSPVDTPQRLFSTLVDSPT